MRVAFLYSAKPGLRDCLLSAIGILIKRNIRVDDPPKIAGRYTNNTAHYLDCIKNNEFEVSSKGKISAKLTIDVKESSGTKRKTITIRKNGSDLYNLSGGRDQYKGYVINEIDAGNGYPFFEKKQPTS